MSALSERLEAIRREPDQNRKNLLVAEVGNAATCLPLVATWEEWERGRAARRALSRRITGGKILRRKEGDPRKDRLLRALNGGERGLPFES